MMYYRDGSQVRHCIAEIKAILSDNLKSHLSWDCEKLTMDGHYDSWSFWSFLSDWSETIAGIYIYTVLWEHH